MKTRPVKLSEISIDSDTQQREKIDPVIVDEYAEAIICGAKFPAVTLFFDGAQYYIADGFHRYWAHKKVTGMLDILADVHDGMKRDARLFSFGVNAAHGLRLTNADKRKSVTGMLADKEWSQWPDDKIAKHCHVTRKYVHQLRTEKSVTKLQNSPQTRMDACSTKPTILENLHTESNEPEDYDQKDFQLEEQQDAIAALEAEKNALLLRLSTGSAQITPEDIANSLNTIEQLQEHIAYLESENKKLHAEISNLTAARDFQTARPCASPPRSSCWPSPARSRISFSCTSASCPTRGRARPRC